MKKSLLAALSLLVCFPLAALAQTTRWRLPAGAIQPQAATDSQGGVHIIYFQGEDAGGNLFYIHIPPDQTQPSNPIRVNSIPESAGAIGTIRAAHIAIGKGNSVHVVWNGFGKKATGEPDVYQAYTRLNAAHSAFEPQRNLITWAAGLDGGGSVTADKNGNVYVAWHAMGGGANEAERGVFLTRSSDGGTTFERERRINPNPTGACACCGMRVFADSNGGVSVLYRRAKDGEYRDAMLLTSKDGGATFQERSLAGWKINACPMSSFAISEKGGKLLAAWETVGRIQWGVLNDKAPYSPRSLPAPQGVQKHPVIVANAQGRILIAWTEGTGWKKGGALVWQEYEANGKPAGAPGRAEGVPVWGLPAAYVRPDGGFVILY